MIKCPNPDCGHDNVAGTQFCEGCGEELSAAAAPTASAAAVKCPACDSMNPPDNQVCEVCGAELDTAPASAAAAAPVPDPTPVAPDPAPVAPNPQSVAPDATVAATAPVDTAPPADASPPADTPTAPGGPALEPGKVKLIVEQGMTVGAQFVLGDAEIQVGREDEDEGHYPDIDLSDQDAGYVHRRHATLKFENGGLTVTHLGGANKTRINNRPLPDNEAQPVQLGDKIAFGKVVVRVHPV